MKQPFKHYVTISGKSYSQLAEIMNNSGLLVKPEKVSAQVLRNWFDRNTPVIVDFDPRNYAIKGMKREHIVMREQEK